jgi:hypothetical protein
LDDADHTAQLLALMFERSPRTPAELSAAVGVAERDVERAARG